MRWFPQSLSVRLFLIVLAGVVLAMTLTTNLQRRERARVFSEYRANMAVTHISRYHPPAGNALPFRQSFRHRRIAARRMAD